MNKVKDVISENETLTDQAKNGVTRSVFQDSSESSDNTEIDVFATKSKGPLSKVALHGPNIVFESRISELEAQLAQSAIDLKKLQTENDDNKRRLAMGLGETGCAEVYRKQIDNLQRFV